MKISYAITVYNELEEIKKLVDHLMKYKREEDEIVILFDNKGPREVHQYLCSLKEQYNISFSVWTFNNNFAEWKNLLNSECYGNYIFQLDADEIPNEYLIQNLHNLLKENPMVDLFFVPRINIVHGITQEHIQKWGWKVNEKGWINFCDYQSRIYKNKPEIKWEGLVHEKIVGTKNYTFFPVDEEWCLLHEKTIERQEKQNNFYNTL